MSKIKIFFDRLTFYEILYQNISKSLCAYLLGSPMDLPNMSMDQWINGSKSRGVKECLLAFVLKALFIYTKYLSIVEGALYT